MPWNLLTFVGAGHVLNAAKVSFHSNADAVILVGQL